MSTSVVLLPEEPVSASTEFTYVLSADGRPVDSVGAASASLLPPQCRQGVVLVLPVRSVAWLRLSLPARVAAGLLGYRTDPARVRSVLAGALEDRLLDDPARLHFALFPAESTGEGDAARDVWVAVCLRDWLQKGLQTLDSAGIPVSSIVAESEPGERGAPATVVWTGNSGAPWVSIASDAGVCNLPHGSGLLAITRELVPGTRVLPEPGAMAAAEAAMGNGVEVQTPGQRLLSAAGSRRNLAQLEFSDTRGNRWSKALTGAWQAFYHLPQWRPVRWGLVMLCLIQVAGLNVLAWQEKKQWAEQRASLRNILLQTFPQVSVVIDPALQMQREVELLAQSRGAASGLDWEPVLSQLMQLPASEWTAIDLEGGQLRIQGSTFSERDIAGLSPVFASRGLTASLQGNTLLVRRLERK